MVDQRAAVGRFVVPIDSTAPRPASRRGAHVESLSDSAAVVEVSATSKLGWSDIAERFQAPWIAPVVVDDRELESYPTGELTVRFTHPPTPEQLKEVTENLSLKLQRRNSYIDTQMVFAPREPATPAGDAVYLPDVCTALMERDDVASTWMVTTSHYQKG